EDYLYTPMTPSTAQYLADRLECTLPTKKIVDIVYSTASIKLDPQPIPPSNRMTTIPVFWDHTDSIKMQFSQKEFERLSDKIVGGHKKDIIISNKIYSSDRNFERVVIYGWHLSVGNPIQPVYNGHIAKYADYSHGVRLIYNAAFLNGDPINVLDILQDPDLHSLLSSEGIISKPYYPESDIFTSVGYYSPESNPDFFLAQSYPNPFNPSTTIKYSIPLDLKRQIINDLETLQLVQLQRDATSLQPINVELKIYDILGREITTLVNEEQHPGEYDVVWNASNYPSGVYFYKLTMDKYSDIKKMMMIK
ncbi:MAG: T9SS type A sorting domain-containing protein, partial [Melioribacteraceae bacterium]|nr:T9SS type A sorting domain-containing protein [Melioribacteraceae bacterium]